MSNTDKIATQTPEEKEALDAIAKPLTRKQVVAIDVMKRAILECNKAGVAVYCGKKMVGEVKADGNKVVLS